MRKVCFNCFMEEILQQRKELSYRETIEKALANIDEYEKARDKLLLKQEVLWLSVLDIGKLPNIRSFFADFVEFLDPKSRRVCSNPCWSKMYDAVIDVVWNDPSLKVLCQITWKIAILLPKLALLFALEKEKDLREKNITNPPDEDDFFHKKALERFGAGIYAVKNLWKKIQEGFIKEEESEILPSGIVHEIELLRSLAVALFFLLHLIIETPRKKMIVDEVKMSLELEKEKQQNQKQNLSN